MVLTKEAINSWTKEENQGQERKSEDEEAKGGEERSEGTEELCRLI